VILTVLGLFPATGFALGIRLFDHDAFATARGDAFVATADNASAIYYNPAGISQLKGHNTRAAFSLLNVDSDFDGRSGRDSSLKDDWILLPGFFYTYSPSNCPISLGLGYYLPFGLALEWPETAPFRTATIYGELQYHTVNPVIAWQITETLSVAAGPTLNYASTDLRRGIAISPDEFKFTGDDYDFGANAGILWQPHKQHSFGLSYRSQTTMNFEGESRVLPAAYLIPKQDASAKLPFPQVVIVGYSFRPTPHWNFEVDFDWTDWDRVNTPVLKQATGDVPLPLRWDSSYAIEVGATRYFDNGMHVSGGYVYIESSIPDKSFTPLVPDQDLHVFSTGVGGHYKRFAWDATYQFTYGPGHDVSGSVYGPSVAGNYNFIAHAFSLSLGYSF
jgi:long-chain fatty acid transport protein